jgi:hypothetical protein
MRSDQEQDDWTEDPLLRIQQKANKLRDKHLKYHAKLKQSKPLTDREWKEYISQTKPLDSHQIDTLRHAIVREGVPDFLRGKLWIKLLKA